MENPYDSPEKATSFNPADDAAAVRTGQVIVICVIAFAVGFSLLTIALFNLASGTQRLPTQLVRFALTVWLAICLYRGQTWARYLMAVLFALAAVFSVFAVPAMLDNADTLVLAFFVAMMAGYAACAVALVAIPSVGRFMEHQRRE